MKLDMERNRVIKAEEANVDMQKQVTELQGVCVQMSIMFLCADNQKGRGRGGCHWLKTQMCASSYALVCTNHFC